MNLRNILLLGLILTGALFYIYKIELPAAEKAEKQELLLGGSTTEEVREIEISNTHGTFTLLNSSLQSSDKKPSDEKQQGATEQPAALKAEEEHWQLKQVAGAEIDAMQIQSLLSAMSELKPGEALVLEEGTNLEVFDLKNPKVQVNVALGAGGLGNQPRTISLSFGKRNEFLSKRYLQVKASGSTEAGSIYLVDDVLYAAVNKEREEFRNKSPIRFTDQDISKISIGDPRNSAKTIVLERYQNQSDAVPGIKNSAWKLSAPLDFPANDMEVSELMRSLRNLKVKKFLDAEAVGSARLGLDKPELIVTLEFKEDLKREPLQVRLARQKNPPGAQKKADKQKKQDTESKQDADGKVEQDSEEVYFEIEGRSGGAFSAESNPLSQLGKSVDAYREKRIARIQVDLVKEISFKNLAEEEIKITRGEQEQGWRVNDKEGDEAFIRQFLNDISQLQAIDFPKQTKEFGFSTPKLRLAISLRTLGQKEASDAATRELALLVGGLVEEKAKSKNYYAGIEGSPEVYIINEESLNKLSPRLETLVKAESK